MVLFKSSVFLYQVVSKLCRAIYQAQQGYIRHFFPFFFSWEDKSFKLTTKQKSPQELGMYY